MTGRLEHKSREGNCWLSMDEAISVLIVMIQIMKGSQTLFTFVYLLTPAPVLHLVTRLRILGLGFRLLSDEVSK